MDDDEHGGSRGFPMLVVRLPSDPTLCRSNTLSSSSSGKVNLIDWKLQSPVGVRHDNNACVRMKSGDVQLLCIQEKVATTAGAEK